MTPFEILAIIVLFLIGAGLVYAVANACIELARAIGRMMR